MNFLIAGIKNWPMHHAWEHAIAEALQAAGHRVTFLGCAPGAFNSCECVDRNTVSAHGDHAAFCAGCVQQQQGVHARAGFAERSLAADEESETRLRQDVLGRSIGELLAEDFEGQPVEKLLLPSLRRWGKSGESLDSFVPPRVLQEHLLTVHRIRRQLPDLLENEAIDTVIVLNGLFAAEQAISLVAARHGCRVINYERGHVRNTLMLSDGGPSCHLELGSRLPRDLDAELDPVSAGLLDRYLDGRHDNQDSNVRFGTDGAGLEGTRTRVCAFANVSWDSSICSRSTVFGEYREWLRALLSLARNNPDLEVVIRVHPGEASLRTDPTIDRTGRWIRAQQPPENLVLVDAEDPLSSRQLANQSDLVVVFCTTFGLELACQGRTVLTCGEVHYAGHGFTVDLESAECFEQTVRQRIAEPLEAETVRRRARSYAYALFFEAPLPFPWVEEVEYGVPQRLAPAITTEWLGSDELLRGLLSWFCGERALPPSLRDLLDRPEACPLPWCYNSRLERPKGALAVLIPAFERPDSLRKVLEGYAAQDCGSRSFRVLVVDDGSSSPLEDSFCDLESRLDLEWLRLPHNSGPARARNTGIEHLLRAGSGIGQIFITGADMIPAQDLVAGLQKARRGWGDPRVALLAHVDWAEGLPVNRVMDLVTRNGMQFGFSGLPARAILPPQYLYTSGVALDAGFLRSSGLRFREDFPYAAWEDTEFSLRAWKAGLVLAYDRDLRVYHDHPMTLDSFCERQVRAGAAARVFERLEPQAYRSVAGQPPENPPDRRQMHALREAARELDKLDTERLRGVQGPRGDLGESLDREQNDLLAQLFRLHHEAGWFSEPQIAPGEGVEGLLSILIPVRDRWALTRDCLEAIRRNTKGPWEVIVVDNGSSDETAAKLAGMEDVLVLRSESNLGFARANNLAAGHARGELLVLLNNDTIVQEGWDEPLRRELADRVTGIVGLRLVYPDGTIQHAGVAFGENGLPWHIYRGLPGMADPVMHRRELSAVTGACLGIRRDLYAAMKGLDENFVNCYEDIDLCLRVRAAGFRVVYNPEGSVIHLEGKTAGRNDRVAHSWRVLLDRWEGRLPRDQERLLAEDGLELESSEQGVRYRRMPRLSAEQEIDRLLKQGERDKARKVLRFRVNQHPDDLGARLRLLDLELDAGNLSAAQALSRGFTLDEKRRERMAVLAAGGEDA